MISKLMSMLLTKFVLVWRKKIHGGNILKSTVVFSILLSDRAD